MSLHRYMGLQKAKLFQHRYMTSPSVLLTSVFSKPNFEYNSVIPYFVHRSSFVLANVTLLWLLYAEGILYIKQSLSDHFQFVFSIPLMFTFVCFLVLRQTCRCALLKSVGIAFLFKKFSDATKVFY